MPRSVFFFSTVILRPLSNSKGPHTKASLVYIIFFYFKTGVYCEQSPFIKFSLYEIASSIIYNLATYEYAIFFALLIGVLTLFDIGSFDC